MAETTTLEAEDRSDSGKGASRRMRRSGRLPVVVYGPEIDSAKCSVDLKAFEQLMHEHGRNAIITLNVSGGTNGSHSTIIKEIQLNPISGQLLHVDFHRISLSQRIVVSIPVTSEGTALGVRNDGGVLEQLLHEIEVECLPTEIPDALTVDVDELLIGDNLHVSDLSAPEGVEIVTDASRSVVMVVPPTVRQTDEEEAEEGEEILDEESQEPELIERGKRDDEEEAEES